MLSITKTKIHRPGNQGVQSESLTLKPTAPLVIVLLSIPSAFVSSYLEVLVPQHRLIISPRSVISFHMLIQYPWVPAVGSGLRVGCCCSCGIGLSCGSDLIPGPGTSYARNVGKKEKKIIGYPEYLFSKQLPSSSFPLQVPAFHRINTLLGDIVLIDKVQTEQPKQLSDQIFKKQNTRSSHFGAAEINLTSIHGDGGLIPGLFQWVKDLILSWAMV